MFNYKTPPDFKHTPTEEEISLVACILNGALKGVRHGCLPAISERIEKKYPKVKPETISRIVYLSLAIISDRQIKAEGWRKVTPEELDEIGRAGKKLTYRSSGIFGVREITLKPKEVNDHIYWMLPRARRKAIMDHSILSGYVKL